MRRASWLLASLALFTIAACGGGNREDTTGGAGSETGTMSGDTASMAPSATPTDTAMSAPGAAGTDTAGDTTQAK